MQAKKTDNEVHIPDSYIKIQEIEDELNKIQGGFPNNYNGIFDELESIKQLISKIGELVLHEEKETKRKRKEILNKGEEHEINDVFETTSKSLKFREYTYNSLLFLIHLNLEKYLIQLCKLINSYPPSDSIETKHKFPKNEFCNISKYYNYLNEQILEINNITEKDIFKYKCMYTEIRDALYHRNGLTEKEYLKEWIGMRNDIVIIDKRIKITNSSLLVSYINEVEFYFRRVLTLMRAKYYSAYEQGKL